MTKAVVDVLVLGAGPAALAIAAALGKEGLQVSALTVGNPREPWPYTYGIWGDEVDAFDMGHLLEHRWSNTVSFFGPGASDPNADENRPSPHHRDYGLFDKIKLQEHWLQQCEAAGLTWHQGLATDFAVDATVSTVTTAEGVELQARLVVDATGYKPVFLRHLDHGPVAVQTCFGVVGRFNKPPVEPGQFVLMDYRCDHLSPAEKAEPPTFLYAMDFGGGCFFLEETSLGLAPPVSLETLRSRLERRLAHQGLTITELQHEELGYFLPMNLPLPDLQQPLLGFGGSAAMVHPASGYLVGSMLRRAPYVAKAVAEAMADPGAGPAVLAAAGWETLWPKELRRKHALYQFGLEKLMRFKEPQLRDFFVSFFALPSEEWYGFLTNTLSLRELVAAMVNMFVSAPWSVRWGLMGMQGRELKLLSRFLFPPR